MMRESNAALEVLAKEEPNELAHRRTLSRGYHWVGVIYHQLGRIEDSLLSYAKALEIQKSVVREYPTLSWVRRTMADTRIGIGISLSESNREREAVVEYETAKAALEALVRENPQVIQFRHRLALCVDCLGLVFDSLGDGPAALDAYKREIELREQTVREAPATVTYRTQLGSVYGHVADYHRRGGRRIESLAYYRNAIETMGDLLQGTIFSQASLSGCASVVAADPDHPTEAEQAEQKALGDRAVSHLRKAVEGGYANLADIDKDSAYRTLRDRADFQALRMDMAFPTDSFAR